MTAISAAGRGLTAAATRLDAAASAVAKAPAAASPAPAIVTATAKTPIGPAHFAPVDLGLDAFDPGQAVADQIQALAAFKANVAAFDAASHLIKALVDIKA